METQTLEGVATETENAPEMVKVLVEKRDGRVVDFDPINIISAVKSAFAGTADSRHRQSGRGRNQGPLQRYGEDRGHPESR